MRGGGGFACFPGSLGCLSLLLELFDGAAAAAAAAATWDGPLPSWAGGGRRPEGGLGGTGLIRFMGRQSTE